MISRLFCLALVAATPLCRGQSLPPEAQATSTTNAAPAGEKSGVAGLKQFVLSDKVRSFSVTVSSGDLGLPAPGASTATKHNLPLQIQVPTADGLMIFESIIELKRTGETSTRLERSWS